MKVKLAANVVVVDDPDWHSKDTLNADGTANRIDVVPAGWD